MASPLLVPTMIRLRCLSVLVPAAKAGLFAFPTIVNTKGHSRRRISQKTCLRMTSPTLTPPRPAAREGFEIAIVCALPLEADAVEALFDVHWDDEGPPFDKAPGDPNAYSTGVIGRHNVVLVRMPGMEKTNAAIVANSCRTSFPSIKLALVVGVCGVIPFGPGARRSSWATSSLAKESFSTILDASFLEASYVRIRCSIPWEDRILRSERCSRN